MKGTIFIVSNPDPAAFERVAREAGFLGFGCYPRSGFIQTSGRSANGANASRRGRPSRAKSRRRASGRPRAGRSSAEDSPASAVRAAGVEVAQEVLAEKLEAIVPLVPYWTRCGGSSSPRRSPASPSRQPELVGRIDRSEPIYLVGPDGSQDSGSPAPVLAITPPRAPEVDPPPRSSEEGRPAPGPILVARPSDDEDRVRITAARATVLGADSAGEVWRAALRRAAACYPGVSADPDADVATASRMLITEYIPAPIRRAMLAIKAAPEQHDLGETQDSA